MNNQNVSNIAKHQYDYANSKNIIARELLYIINNNFNEKLLYESLIIMCHECKNDDDFMKNCKSLFIVVPLLKHSNEYNDASINYYYDMLNNCYTKANYIDKLSYVCNVYNDMIDKCKFDITHKNVSYFKDIFDIVSNTKIKFIEDIIIKSVTDVCNPIQIKVDECKDCLSSIPFVRVNEKNNANAIYFPPRTNLWSACIINCDDMNIGMSWRPMVNIREDAENAEQYASQIMFLGYCDNNTYIHNNQYGTYAPMKASNNALIHKTNDKFEIYSDDGKTIFKCSQIVVAFKNIYLTVDSNVDN